MILEAYVYEALRIRDWLEKSAMNGKITLEDWLDALRIPAKNVLWCSYDVNARILRAKVLQTNEEGTLRHMLGKEMQEPTTLIVRRVGVQIPRSLLVAWCVVAATP